MLKYAILVFIGGGAGSVARFILGLKLNSIEQSIPYGTLLANVLGSLIIGLLFGFMDKSSYFNNSYYYLLAVGFCGGFTTFSSFAYEKMVLLRSGDFISFFTYMFVTLFLGLAAVSIGLYIAKTI